MTIGVDGMIMFRHPRLTRADMVLEFLLYSSALMHVKAISIILCLTIPPSSNLSSKIGIFRLLLSEMPRPITLHQPLISQVLRVNLFLLQQLEKQLLHVLNLAGS